MVLYSWMIRHHCKDLCRNLCRDQCVWHKIAIAFLEGTLYLVEECCAQR